MNNATALSPQPELESVDTVKTGARAYILSGHSQMTLLISQAHSFSIISILGLKHSTMTIQSI